MEARRGKGLSNRGSAASGKENICPSLSSREPLSASRSPLPESFPRVPLQDITQILSPINTLPINDDGDVTRGRKRSKRVVETQTPSCTTRSECELISSYKEWRGFRKCVTHQAVSRDVHVKGESNLTEAVRRQTLPNVTENTELIDEAKHPDSVKIAEESLGRETRETEKMLAGEVLKAEDVEASGLVRSLRTMPKRPLRLSSSSPTTRASLRSSQEKLKMSSIMKFR